MDAYEVFRTIVDKYVVALAKIVGHNPFELKINFATYFSVFIWYSLFLTSIYTAFTADRADALLSVYFALFTTQGLVKSFVNLTKRNKRKAVLDYLTKLYKANKSNMASSKILSKFIRWNMILTKLFTFVMIGTAVACIFIPLTISLLMGRMEHIFPMHIPFVPKDTFWGYWIHCVFFISAIVTGACGTVSNEVFLLTTTMHIWPMYKIMDEAVIGLNQATGSLRKEAVINSTWLHRRVRNIVLMHKEIYFYVSEMSTIDYPISSIELYSDQWSLIILIYVIIVLKWPPAILLFLTMFTKLFLFCSFGTAIEILNDRIYNTLSNIDFVVLPPSEKKLILFMLHQSQHPPSLRAGLVPLNIMTFADVLKTVYSFTMMLLEFA